MKNFSEQIAAVAQMAEHLPKKTTPVVQMAFLTVLNTWRAFLKRPENFSGPETVPQSSRNDFRVFLKATEKF